jgi:hypothetical protein
VDRRRLRLVLGLGDATAMLIAVSIGLTTVGYDRLDHAGLVLAPIAAAIGLWAVHFQGLWDSRVTAMRWIDLSKLTRAVGIPGVGMLCLDASRRCRRASISRCWRMALHAG